MHVISQKALRDFESTHPAAKAPLAHWFKLVKQSEFHSFQDIRNTFPSADWVDGLVIFMIGGNNYRLIAAVHFNRQKLYVRDLLTHAEYDKRE